MFVTSVTTMQAIFKFAPALQNIHINNTTIRQLLLSTLLLSPLNSERKSSFDPGSDHLYHQHFHNPNRERSIQFFTGYGQKTHVLSNTDLLLSPSFLGEKDSQPLSILTMTKHKLFFHSKALYVNNSTYLSHFPLDLFQINFFDGIQMRARRHFLVSVHHEMKSAREEILQGMYRRENSSGQQNRN